MTHSFDKDYWEQHWHGAPETDPAAAAESLPNPYVQRIARQLSAGPALDAGCGTGTEALELAAHGWDVVGADISSTALETASRHAADRSLSGSVTWAEADLVSWEPGRRFDLVMTNYAHPATPQLAFYQRIMDWVAPDGTLLIIGHAHDPAAMTAHGHRPPGEATVTAADVAALLDPVEWTVTSADTQFRTVTAPDGQTVTLPDVVVQAARRS